MKNRILAFVQSKGPVLPVEAAKAVDTNSFLAKAYLSDLVDEDKVKLSNQKFGAENLYFVPGQEQAVAERLKQVAQHKTAKQYQDTNKATQVTPELEKKRREFSEMAKKVEQEDRKVKMVPQKQNPEQPVKFSLQQKNQSQKPTPRFSVFRRQEQEKPEEKIIEVKKEQPEPEPGAKKIEQIPTKTQTFVDRARNLLEMEGGKIAEVIERKKKFAEFNATLPTAFGEFKVLVHIRDKKRVTDSDISLLYSKCTQRNIIGLMMTKGKLNKKARRFLDSVKDTVKVKEL